MQEAASECIYMYTRVCGCASHGVCPVCLDICVCGKAGGGGVEREGGREGRLKAREGERESVRACVRACVCWVSTSDGHHRQQGGSGLDQRHRTPVPTAALPCLPRTSPTLIPCKLMWYGWIIIQLNFKTKPFENNHTNYRMVMYT